MCLMLAICTAGKVSDTSGCYLPLPHNCPKAAVLPSPPLQVFRLYPLDSTETMATTRTDLVCQLACATNAQKLDLDAYLQMGPSYLQVQPTEHMSAEMFEAVLGAIFVDCDMQLELIEGLFERHWPLRIKGKG